MSFNPEITCIEEFEVESKASPNGPGQPKFPHALPIPLASDDCQPPSGGCYCNPYHCV